jgi:hypothetical protein
MNDYNKLVDFTVGVNCIKLTIYDFAKTNEIYTVFVTSIQDIICELLQFEI